MSSRADLELIDQLRRLNETLRRVEVKLDLAMRVGLGAKLEVTDTEDGPISMPPAASAPLALSTDVDEPELEVA